MFMFDSEIAFLGIALAIDAAVVTFALGLLMVKEPAGIRIARGLTMCLLFGFFQGLMIWVGSFAGYFFTFSAWGYLSQVVVALIFILIGLKFFREAQNPYKERGLSHGFLPLIILSLATSLDALASGVSLGTYPQPWLPALDVGAITLVICGLFFTLSQFLENIPEKWLLYFAGGVFNFLALKILLPYFIRGF
jgi:manganese efflux pump family protein